MIDKIANELRKHFATTRQLNTFLLIIIVLLIACIVRTLMVFY